MKSVIENRKARFLRQCLFIACIVSCTPINAQIDEFKQRYEEFKNQARQEFDDFREKANKQYAYFVRQSWEKFRALPAIPKPKEDVVPPVVMPIEEEEKPILDNEIPVIDITPIIEEDKQPVPPSPIEEQPQPAPLYFTFKYTGTEFKARLDDTMKFKLENIDENHIADKWMTLSDTKYNNLIRDCLELRIQNNLCDWAYLGMLKALCEDFLGKGTNEATLLTAFLYCQSGYKMRLARYEDRLYILFASKHEIYEMPYFIVGNEYYYPVDYKGDELFLCNASFPEEQSLSLQITKVQKFAWADTGDRTIQSKRYPDIKFTIACNQNTIDFYNTYPSSMCDNNFMTRWAVYANTPLEEGIKNALYPAIKSKINGLTKKESVERLLNWVQTGLVYEFDDKVWGGDRAFFPEETLYYPYCDCEDRSILLTRLVRDLLGLKCILVYYPGHLASAICFDEEVKGDYITLDGKRYTICDPTYIGAPVGVTMPDMNNAEAKVILLE